MAASEHSNGRRLGEKLGAALYSGSIPVSVGFNVFNKTHPKARRDDGYSGRYDLNCHAEHMALIKRQYHADKRLVMYVYRAKFTGPTNNTDRPASRIHACSRPCKICQRHLLEAGVRTVRFIDASGHPAEMKIK